MYEVSNYEAASSPVKAKRLRIVHYLGQAYAVSHNENPV